MNIIIPMAGMGKRLRPHTLTTPKPLVRLVGKPIVTHLVEEIIAQAKGKVEKIAFVIGRFGKEVEDQLLEIAASHNCEGLIRYQDEALGTAHAILCAKDVLNGPVVVAFADTLFRADFTLDEEIDGVLWVERVKDPSAFGVVQLNDEGHISSFVEKPQEFVSDMAMIGIYYFKQGEILREEMEYLIENNIMNDGEYQLPDALRAMVEKGYKFIPGTVEEWLDCGNYKATVNTNKQWLKYKSSSELINKGLKLENAKVIKPCYIGENVSIKNAIVGPYVSLDGDNTIESTVISNSIVGKGTDIENAVIEDSMIGNQTKIYKDALAMSVGDYNTL